MTEKIGGFTRPNVESKPTGTQAPQRPDDAGRAERSSTTTETGRTDAVSLTETATRLKAIEAKLQDQPDIDRERVDALRNLIDAGDFEVNSQQIARKLAELERLLY